MGFLRRRWARKSSPSILKVSYKWRMKKLWISTVGLLLLSSCSAGGGFVSGEESEFLIDACAPVFNRDWDSQSIDSLLPLGNDYNTIKNQASGYSESTRSTIGELSTLMSEMSGLYDEYNSRIRGINADVLSDEYISQLEAVEEWFLEEQGRIASETNSLCEGVAG